MTSKTITADAIIAEALAAGRTALDEAAAKRLLAAYGIAVPRSLIARDAADAAEKAQTLVGPLVVKVV